MTAVLLDMDRVTFGYGDGPPVLSDASLSLPERSVCGVLGPNGAGKSTLARLAAGVFAPRTGSVRIGDQHLNTLAGSARARLVRVTFQTPEHELFRSTLGAELDWEAGLLGLESADLRASVERMLADCGATVPLDTHPYDLDPWQRKLFACVAALAVPGRLVVLDEPTLRLGQAVRTTLGRAIRHYSDAGGGVLIVTHDHEFAAAICDTIAVVKGGKIDRNGPVTETLRSAADHAGTNIYSFPSFYLDRAVHRRSKLPEESGRNLQM